jgi:putative membrane protein
MGDNKTASPPSAQTETSQSKYDDPRIYLAVERTFLAWIRTGLALMGFGFVVARFGIFLRELDAQQTAPAPPHPFSVWTGTALVLIGVVVNLMAVFHHTRLVRELSQGINRFDRPSALAIVVAVVLAVIGLAMAVYLAVVR